MIFCNFLLSIATTFSPPAFQCTGIPTHIADFSKSDSPCGLSRGGYYGAGYNLNLLGFFQQFWNDTYYITNRNNNWVCIDLGTGRGGQIPPAPLVAGGAFVFTAPGEGDFGPYSAPLHFTTNLKLWSQFTQASISTQTPPAEASQLAGFKQIGVTFVVDNAEGTTVARQLTAGVWDSGPLRRLDIFTNTLQSQTGGGAAITVLGTTHPWVLSLSVDPGSVTVTVTDGTTGLNQSVTATTAAPGVPLSIQDVRSAALRFSGLYSVTPIETSRIEICSANIPPFDGPPTSPSGPNSSSMPFVVRRGGALIMDPRTVDDDTAAGGGQFQAAGVNRIDLLNYFAGFDATPEYAEYLLDKLVSETNGRIVQFTCTDEFTKYLTDSSAAPGWPRSNYPLCDLWEDGAGHAKYLAAFDRLVDEAAERNIYLIPRFFNVPDTPYVFKSSVSTNNLILQQCALDPNCPDHLEARNHVRRVYGLSGGPINQDELDAQAFVLDMVTTLATRYAGVSTILTWDLGPEWDNYVLKDQYAFPNPTSIECYDASCYPNCPSNACYPFYQWWNSPEDCRDAVNFLATTIRNATIDLTGPNGARHPLFAGYSDGGLRLDVDPGSGRKQTVAGYHSNLPRFYSDALDMLSFHAYPSPGTNGCSSTSNPCDYAGTCLNWPPVPYESWECLVKDFRNIANTMPSGGPRPVVFGETNHNEGTYDDALWTSVLDSYAGDTQPGATPRVDVVLAWAWMTVPHLIPTDGFDMRPEDLTPGPPFTRAERFEEFVSEHYSRPRVVASGFDTTYAVSGQNNNVLVRARISDPQGYGDIAVVRLLKSNGDLVMNLAHISGSLWGGTMPLFTVHPARKFYTFEAEDLQGHVSYRVPRLTVAPPAPAGPQPQGTEAPNSGQVLNIPYVRTAGSWGFNPLSSEGHHRRFVVEVVDANGQPLPSTPAEPVVVTGRINTAFITWDCGWGIPIGACGTNSEFTFFDDGVTAGDLTAGDGVWTCDFPVGSGAAPQELLVEILVRRTQSGGVRNSDIWPRLISH